MRNIIIAVSLLSMLVFTSCEKDSNQGEIDRGLIEAYALDHNLDGQFTASGLYYEIIEPGNNFHPTLNSEITVSYTGYYLDDEIFDEGEYLTGYLGAFIDGWQEGLQLIGEEGQIKLVVPSALAYGSTGKGPIGPNEVLVFDVTLNYFNK